MPRVIHFDIAAREPQKAIEFYSKVFGWRFDKWNNPMMDYWLVMTGDEKTPGIDGGLGVGDPVSTPVLTIDVTDLDATLEKVGQNGGKVVQPRGAIPGVGWFAAIEDPTGNQFGLMQEDRAAR